MITDKLKELAQYRSDAQSQKGLVEKLQKKLELTEEWISLQEEKEQLKGLSVVVEQLEEEVRDLAHSLFDGQNKKPFIGIEIKEFSVVKVLDEKRALVWASQNAPSILKLDQTKFKKAVENLELDFVEKGVEYRVQIASDLSEYLK